MPDDFELFARFAPHIAALPDRDLYTREDLLVPAFQLHRQNELAIYYVPFDYVNTQAKVIIVGITPGFTQMEIAYREAHRALLDGLPSLDVCKRAESVASFAGTMRQNLLGMLDGIGLPEALGIASSASLFGVDSGLVHTTSAIRYSVFVNGENYTGHTPRLVDSPVLQEYVHGILLDELRSIRDALVIPLGLSVSHVLQILIDGGQLTPDQCLIGFPHPSGQNGHRAKHYEQRRSGFIEQVRTWFDKQPIKAAQITRTQDEDVRESTSSKPQSSQVRTREDRMSNVATVPLGGTHVAVEGPGRVAVRRETRESLAEVRVDDGARRDCTIETGLNFFDHMLETISWNACLNLEVSFSHKRYRLTHVITEDVGLTLGRALGRLLEERTPGGINGAGSGIMAIDEAIAIALISFEGRANAFYDLATPGGQHERVEDMLSADLIAFFDGLAQGARCTIHLRSLQGIDPHHVWESVFRAFGVALRGALARNEWRAGLTAGIKGTLD